MNKNILSFTSEEALDFFLKSNQYHNFEMPLYFKFDEVLQFVKETVADKSFEECLVVDAEQKQGDVNFEILVSKDGKYAVRTLSLCNPYLYYFLAREICLPANWERIKEIFLNCTVPTITSCAMIVIPKKKEDFHQATTILNWWRTFEQRSIELSLKYRYMFITDITNCYDSINLDCIDSALSLKDTEYATSDNAMMSRNIKRYLQVLQNGHNSGIPQGSSVFDLVAEIILSYTDLLLYQTIQNGEITQDYEILRYRDDYRVFCNDKDELEKISYKLQQVLEMFNFRLNTDKTRVTDSIVTDSIKPDKLYYIENTPIYSRKSNDFDSIQKELLYILMFGRKFPNSGQLKGMLKHVDDRVKSFYEPRVYKFVELEDLNKKVHQEGIKLEVDAWKLDNVPAMVAVAAQIAVENVKATHNALSVISRLINILNESNRDGNSLLDMVCEKLNSQPNSAYSKLWLQYLTFERDNKRKQCPYDNPLCHLAMGEEVRIWNFDWLLPELTRHFPLASVVGKEELKKISPILPIEEEWAYDEDFEEEDPEMIGVKLREKLKSAPVFRTFERDELVLVHNDVVYTKFLTEKYLLNEGCTGYVVAFDEDIEGIGNAIDAQGREGLTLENCNRLIIKEYTKYNEEIRYIGELE